MLPGKGKDVRAEALPQSERDALPRKGPTEDEHRPQALLHGGRSKPDAPPRDPKGRAGCAHEAPQGNPNESKSERDAPPRRDPNASGSELDLCSKVTHGGRACAVGTRRSGQHCTGAHSSCSGCYLRPRRQESPSPLISAHEPKVLRTLWLRSFRFAEPI